MSEGTKNTAYMQIFCVEWCRECGVIRFSVVFIFCNDLYNNATRHIFLCGSVVVWECVYLLCYFLCVFVDFICIYAIFFVPLHPQCIIQTVGFLIHKLGLFWKVGFRGLFIGVLLYLSDKT